MKSTIPKSHPRYLSLITREKIALAMRNGVVHETGLIAHGRGEAFDYLLGEQTIPEADSAEKVAAAALLCAINPVISVNGNVVALATEECIRLAGLVPAKLEINLFHRTKVRMKKIDDIFHKKGVQHVYGLDADAIIPGLDHLRALCSKEGIFSADVVLVPLEDGDRCEALKQMGKTVIVVDLNPLSRSARMASITIVDNVTRAVPRICYWVEEFQGRKHDELEQVVADWNNKENLRKVMGFLSKRLNALV